MLEAYLAARAQLELDEARGLDAVAGAQELTRRFSFLAEDEAHEIAASLSPSAPVEAQESAAMRTHLLAFRELLPRARAAAIRTAILTDRFPLAGKPMSWPEVAPRLSMGRTGHGLDEGLARAASPHVRELTELAVGCAGEVPLEGVATADRWLAATDDLQQAAKAHVAPEASELASWMAALAKDSPWSPRGRLRRAAERMFPLGLSSLLQRVQLLPPRRDVLFGVRVVSVRPPHDLRMAPPAADLGALSEVDAAHAVGRAVAQLLVAPALPAALRWNSDATVPQVFGGLSSQVLFTNDSLTACLSARERDQQRRRLGALLLTAVRSAAAYASWAGSERSAAGAGERSSRALGLSVDPDLALLLAPSPVEAVALFRGAHDALAIWAALREMLDQDWYKNPRAADVLRSAAGRGAGLSSQEWLAELGGESDLALARAHELFPS